ncbi:MAG: hypothetical protein KDK23_17120 [Leptospiraceae bacterium]|nr:hypothetical protein [Leptospiraceae bacterium]
MQRHRLNSLSLALLWLLLSGFSCDGSRITALRTATIVEAGCETLEFQMVRGERGMENESVFYTGQILSAEDGYSIVFEEPAWMKDERYDVQSNARLFPLLSDATGHGVFWNWLKLYCPGQTEPVFDSGRIATDPNTCYYEKGGYWITLLEPAEELESTEFCCEPLVGCGQGR